MNALTIVHDTIKKYIGEGAFCIDATAGRGYDTAFLCEIVGKTGKVIAFDVQAEAIESTRQRLDANGLSADLYLDSHANMGNYAKENSVDCIVFNLGYLPHGDHSVNTRADSSIAAINAGLKLLKRGGLMCVSLYYGGDSGYEERDALLPYFSSIDDKYYQVLTVNFTNWTNDPPIPVFIIKN